MDVVVQFTVREEVKALPILLRLSPGIALRERTYVISQSAMSALRKRGVAFRILSRNGAANAGTGAAAGERV